MSPLITVGQGGPNIPDGVYPVALTALAGPRTVTAKRGANAGKDVELFDWTFVVMGGDYEDTEIQESSSTASGPRSKMYGWLTALFGGQAPPAGTALEANDLVGRLALATIQRDPETGWPKIVSLGAMPQQMLSQQFARTTGAPAAVPTPPAPVIQQQQVPAAPTYVAPQPAPAAQQPVSPLREQVAAQPAGTRDLPF